MNIIDIILPKLPNVLRSKIYEYIHLPWYKITSIRDYKYFDKYSFAYFRASPHRMNYYISMGYNLDYYGIYVDKIEPAEIMKKGTIECGAFWPCKCDIFHEHILGHCITTPFSLGPYVPQYEEEFFVDTNSKKVTRINTIIYGDNYAKEFVYFSPKMRQSRSVCISFIRGHIDRVRQLNELAKMGLSSFTLRTSKTTLAIIGFPKTEKK